MIRVVIADDHPAVLDGIRYMLLDHPHIEILATYLNGKELLEGMKTLRPDVLILDFQMPGQTGDELALIIQREYPETAMLAFTNFDNTLYVNSMLRNGVRGYLLKNTDKQTLITAIETVYNGGTFLLPGMEEQVAQYRGQIRRKMPSRIALTPREKDILRLIAQGQTNNEIARSLSLSQRTVENYRFNLCLKLQVNNVAGLIRKAFELGLEK
jgi:DNA-binding NarL/FixJ family response regulator